MNGLDILDVTRFSMLVLMKIMTPILLVALVTGVVVSLLQTLTQIQESTLSFVPKIFSVCLVLFLSGGWMAEQLNQLVKTILLYF